MPDTPTSIARVDVNDRLQALEFEIIGDASSIDLEEVEVTVALSASDLLVFVPAIPVAAVVALVAVMIVMKRRAPVAINTRSWS